MARGEQLLRHWRILHTLQTRGAGVPLRDLARELETSERTVQRDLGLLFELGFPVEYEEDEFGKRHWRLPHNFIRTGAFALGLTEAVSLVLAQHLVAPLAGTLFADGLASLVNKVRSQLPAAGLEYFRALDQTVHVRRIGRTDYAIHADKIRMLTEAARGERAVEVDYHSLWRASHYTTRVDPYGLVFHEGDLFVVGRSYQADALRMFKITRIAAVRALATAFRRPADFALEDYFRNTFGIVRGVGRTQEVVLRFDPAVAALVEERHWHSSQQLEWLTDGDGLFAEESPHPSELRVTLRLNDFVELKRWVLGFGAGAEVLRPAWLRAEIAAELAGALRRYE